MIGYYSTVLIGFISVWFSERPILSIKEPAQQVSLSALWESVSLVTAAAGFSLLINLGLSTVCPASAWNFLFDVRQALSLLSCQPLCHCRGGLLWLHTLLWDGSHMHGGLSIKALSRTEDTEERLAAGVGQVTAQVLRAGEVPLLQTGAQEAGLGSANTFPKSSYCDSHPPRL